MAAFQPFNPAYGQGQTVTASTTSAAATIQRGAYNVRVVNSGATNAVYIRVGNSANGTVTATAADLLLQPGAVEVLTKSPDDDRVAYLAAAATTTVNIMPGEGW